MVAHDVDACEIWVFLFGTELADYFGEGGAFSSVAWDILEADDAKGVAAFGVFPSNRWSFADALS